MSVMPSAASGLAWLTRLTGAKDEASLLAQMRALPQEALERAPVFLPYLSGERTPHNDAAARGAFSAWTTTPRRPRWPIQCSKA